MTDEWEQYKTSASTDDEWSQYKTQSSSVLSEDPLKKELLSAGSDVAVGGMVGLPQFGIKSGDALPIAFGALSGATAGLPRAMIENQQELQRGGVVGAQFAQGANIATQIGNHPVIQMHEFLKNNFDTTPSRMYGKEVNWITPKTVSGAVSQALLESLMPGAEAGVLGGKKFSPVDELQKLRETQTKLVAEFLQPKKARGIQSVKSGIGGKELPEVSVGTEVIKKADSGQDVVDQFTVAKNDNINAVKTLIAQDNQPVGSEYISEAKILVEKAKKDKILDADAIKNMEDRIIQEEQFLKENPDFDALKAQDRKIALEQQTESLLRAREKGQNIATKPGVDLVEDKLRSGLMKRIESINPEIGNLNSKYAGLKNGQDLAASIAWDEKVIPKDLLGKLAWVLGRPSWQSGVAAAVREIPMIGKTTKAMTGKIEGIGKRMDLLADLIARSKGERLKQLTGARTYSSLKEAPRQLGQQKLLTEQGVIKGLEQKQISGRTVGGRKLLPEPEKFTRTRLASWERR